MKKLCFVVVLLVAAGHAQTIAGNITASASSCVNTTGLSSNGACVIAPVSSNTALAVIGVGSFTGATIQFESYDGIQWTTLYPMTGGGVSSTTAAGTWQFNVGGYTAIRARASSYTSGPISINISFSTGGGQSSGGTGPFIDQGGAVYNIKAYGGLAATIAAVNQGTGPAVIEMAGTTTTQHLTSQTTISVPVKIQGCETTISMDMNTDPGQASGNLVINSDNVTIEGTGKFGGCIITRPNNSPVENLIYSGSHNNIRIAHLEIDGNEDNQTYVDTTTTYFTGWHTAKDAVSSGLQLEDVYITRGGARGIDWRGVSNYYVNDLYLYKNGQAVGGACVAKGNSVSIDVGYDGVNWIPSHDGTVSNVVDIVHGDSFKAGNYRYTLNNYVYRGAVDLGLEPWYTETGLDAVGANSSTITNFYISNAYNATLNLNNYALSGTPIITKNNAISNGTVYADSTLCYGGGACNTHCGGTGSNVAYGDVPLTDATTGVAPTNNSFANVNFIGSPLVAINTANTTIAGGNVNGVAAAGWSALPSSGILFQGATTTNYHVRGTTFAGVTNGIEITNTVTAPGACSVAYNVFDPAITNKWKYDTGAATICDASNGGATVVGRLHLTGLSASNALTNIASSTPAAGSYQVCGYTVTTTGQSTCTIAMGLSYTNPGGATTPSLTSAAGIGGTAGLDRGACVPIYLASGNVQISTTVGTCSPSTLRYELDAWLVQQ